MRELYRDPEVIFYMMQDKVIDAPSRVLEMLEIHSRIQKSRSRALTVRIAKAKEINKTVVSLKTSDSPVQYIHA
jgi:hypothetical protein